MYIEMRSNVQPDVLSRAELYVFIDEFFRLRGDAISNDDKVYLTWLVYVRLVSPHFVFAYAISS